MINKLLNFCFLFFTVLIVYTQTTVSGYVKGVEDKPLENTIITLLPSGKTVETDKIGYFQFKNVEPGTYEIEISKFNYIDKKIEFKVTNEKKLILENIQLTYDPSSANQGIITLTDDELDSDESQNQSSLSLLQSSRDAFSRAAAYELGGYWFKVRGLDNRYLDINFNGVQMNKQDNGRVDFGNWGGLNDVTRYPMEIAEGISPSQYSFGNLSSTTHLETRASSYRKGTRLTYSLTNRSYRNRLMLTHFTGLNPKGWAFAFSASRRWAEEGVIDGTYYDAYGYFLSIEKQFNKKHALSLTTFGAPGRRSSNSPNTLEVYGLKGKDYNSYWGWYDGEKRSERIKKYFEPIAMLSHYWNINDNTKLKTTLGYQTGTYGASRLDWNNANSPSPTYYRNLPSWAIEQGATQENLDILYDRWQNDASYSQINWNSLYHQNLNIPIENHFGEEGRRAAYYLVYDKNDDTTISFNTHLSTQLQENWDLYANFGYQHLKSENYREIDDLMGADFALNVDDFNNNTPFGGDLVVREGGKIEYNFDLNRDTYKANVLSTLKLDKWQLDLSALFGYTESYRNGKFLNGLYPNNSLGKSGIENFFEIGLKGKVTYKINGRHYLVANSGYFTASPTLNEIFFNARANNTVVPDLKTQKINSNDISYIIRTPKVKTRLTGYYTTIKDAIDISRFYAEGLALSENTIGEASSTDAFITEILTDADKLYWGGELGLEYAITSSLTLSALGSFGQYTYNNNPQLYLNADDQDNQGIVNLGKSYIEDYKLSSGPQVAGSLGLRYYSPKYWWIGASANYLANSYIDISPLLRTNNFGTNPVTENPYFNYDLGRYITQQDIDDILVQEQYSDEFMLNASVGKSFKFGKYYMGISANVNNILNNRNYVTGGFEQGRNANFNDLYEDKYENQNPIFGSKYWFNRGTSYFINIYLRF